MVQVLWEEMQLTGIVKAEAGEDQEKPGSEKSRKKLCNKLAENRSDGGIHPVYKPLFQKSWDKSQKMFF
jgi:hypothetical protein